MPLSVKILLVVGGALLVILVSVIYRIIRRTRREIEIAKIRHHFMVEEFRIHQCTLQACKTMENIAHEEDKLQKTESETRNKAQDKTGSKTSR